MHCFRLSRVGLLLAVISLAAVPAAAVTVKIEFDEFNTLGLSSPFFNSGSQQAAQAKATLNAAAAFYSTILTDTLDAIVPPTYSSPRVNIAWNWTMGFSNPNGAGTLTLMNQVIPADEFRIFAGAQTFGGDTLATAGPGNVQSWGRPGIPPAANSTDISQIHAIDDAFEETLTTRGETSGFVTWGGSISLDNDSNWHFNHTTAPTAGKTDLYSVAVHEIAHILGFGASTTWTSLVSGSNFVGSTTMASYGGPVPLGAGNGHWADGTTSTVFGGSTSQIATMGPSLTPATRRWLTALDAAALTDIGWSVVPPPGIHGDYNNNGIVDAADYVIWRDKLNQSVTIPNDSTPGMVTAADYSVWRANFGKTPPGSGSVVNGGAVPEPAGGLLATIACVVALYPCRKRCG